MYFNSFLLSKINLYKEDIISLFLLLFSWYWKILSICTTLFYILSLFKEVAVSLHCCILSCDYTEFLEDSIFTVAISFDSLIYSSLNFNVSINSLLIIDFVLLSQLFREY